MSARRREGGRSTGGAGTLRGLLAAAAVLAAGSPAPAAGAQELPRPAAGTQEAGDGWLGVGLVSFSECLEDRAGRAGECRHALVVGGLVQGGPADRAGLQPGDTLLAVDGTRLADGLGDDAFRRLEPGEPVSILVGRPEGRVRLEAVPTPHPDSLAIVRRHRAGPYAESRARYLLAVPDPAVLDSLVSSRSDGPSAAVRVSVIPAERVRQVPLQPDPRVGAAPEAGEVRERFSELRDRARQVRRRAFEQIRELRRDVTAGRAADRVDSGDWKRWVAEELQPQLEVVYDSVLTEARDRMDSLRAMYPPLAARAASRARAGDSALGESRPPARAAAARAAMPPSPEELGMPGNRIAGAELQPLNPELAAFFDGVERGLLVLQVLSATPASELGLRPGDVIVEAAGRPVASLTGFRRALMEQAVPEVRWVRRGRPMADTLRH